jgi:hypothetical protein
MDTATVVSGRQRQYITAAGPVALAIYKPGRGSSGDGWVVVAKITHYYGSSEPILATAWRNQRGTVKAISLPQSVLDYAEAAGVRRFCLRDDRRMVVYGCTLATFRRGRLRADGERYLPLDWLRPEPWRDWAFAERVIRLAKAIRPAQLDLFSEVSP